MMKKKAIISALCVCLGSGFIGAVAWAGSIGQEAACTVASGKSILLCADVQDVVKGMGKKEENQEEKKENEAEAKEAKEKLEEGGGEQAAEVRAEEAPKQASAERLTGGQTQAAEASRAAAGGGSQSSPEPASTQEPVPAPEPKQPAHVHSYDIPVYGTEQVYVVDQEAWTETVSEPVYDVVERSICSVCGADVTGNPAGHAKDHAMAGEGGGHYSEWQQVQVGTNTYTVQHPEQGHYESRSIVTGYQCSCGAAQ